MDFNKVYKEHYPQVVKTARSYLRNTEDAEDAAQDTFLEAYESLDAYDDTYAVSTWLNRICANKCRDKLRRKKLENKSFVAVTHSNESILDSQEDATSPELVMQAEDEGHLLLNTFLQLPENIIAPLTMKLVEDVSYQEIADKLGIPLSTAKTRVRRGRTKLLQAIAPQ